ncbi:MAG: trehalase family glycosidase [Tenuifilaceae bacterium]
MKNIPYFLIFLCSFAQISLSAQNIARFPNILDIKAYPEQKNSTSGLFSDQGAWFGFCLLPDTTNITGFGGPWIIAERKWTSLSLVKLEVIDGSTKKQIELKIEKQTYFPGIIKSNYSSSIIKLELSLYFGKQGIAYQTATITNISNSEIKISFNWNGNSWQKIEKNSENKLVIKYKDERSFNICLNRNEGRFAIDTANNSYKTDNPRVIALKPGENTFSWISMYYSFFENESNQAENSLPVNADEVSLIMKESSKRWEEYLKSSLLKTRTEYDVIAIKSIMTLISNWRKAGLDLHHDGIIPSHAVTYFDGFWAWDSWKHAVAVSNFAPELAKNQISAMFDYQDSLGMVPDCIFLNKSENNLRDTKPPLAAWAVFETYNNSKDLNFVRSMLPKLLKYHDWWYKYRDYNKNGWCEYGSTDGTLEAAAWESGMDNAVRFDSVKMLHTGGVAWSMDQESVDLNAYLVAEKYYLSQLLKIAGINNESERFKKDYDRLASRFEGYFYDKSKGYYYDVSVVTGSKIFVEGTEAFTPLWAKIASESSAKGVKNIIMNSSKFNTFMPFPTLTSDHPKFDTKGYWRGPVWIDQAWFGVVGLDNYNYRNEAKELTLKLFRNADGLLKDKPMHENYNPLTGERLKAPHFSWSAAHYLLLYRMGYHLYE